MNNIIEATNLINLNNSNNSSTNTDTNNNNPPSFFNNNYNNSYTNNYKTAEDYKNRDLKDNTGCVKCRHTCGCKGIEDGICQMLYCNRSKHEQNRKNHPACYGNCEIQRIRRLSWFIQNNENNITIQNQTKRKIDEIIVLPEQNKTQKTDSEIDKTPIIILKDSEIEGE